MMKRIVAITLLISIILTGCMPVAEAPRLTGAPATPSPSPAPGLPARETATQAPAPASATPAADSAAESTPPTELPPQEQPPEPPPEQPPVHDPSPSTKMSFAELVGDNKDNTKPDGAPPAGTYHIEVDVTNQVVSIYNQEDGALARQMLCTTGLSKTPTPMGDFKIGNRKERFGYFDEFGVYGQYWTQITGAIFFHSVLYRSRNAESIIKSSYNNLGKRASHGCIRLTVPDARWIYYNIAPGTPIKITKKDKNPQLTQSLKLPPIP